MKHIHRKKPKTPMELAIYRYELSLRVASNKLNETYFTEGSELFAIGFAINSLCHALRELPDIIAKGKCCENCIGK